jgi:hypothetical protein
VLGALFTMLDVLTCRGFSTAATRDRMHEPLKTRSAHRRRTLPWQAVEFDASRRAGRGCRSAKQRHSCEHHDPDTGPFRKNHSTAAGLCCQAHVPMENSRDRRRKSGRLPVDSLRVGRIVRFTSFEFNSVAC